MQLANGARLGSYEIVVPLGAGGMGEVYRARDLRLGREVALKVLPAEVAASPDRLARFEREARAVAGLSHPNVVVLHSIEEQGGVRFLTMELVEGRSLATYVTPGGLPLARVLPFSIAIAEALVAAHEKGIVHRDLKPANVMVTPEGRVKVLDFGLAKLAQAEPMLNATQAVTVESPISDAGQLLGTGPYMSPEQVRGEAVDARSDLFSLGILLYELATGRRPFGGETFADLSSAILRDQPVPLLALRPDLPRDLDRVTGRCLEKDRERRFQTARDVRNELEIIQRDTSSPSSSAPSQATSGPAAHAVPVPPHPTAPAAPPEDVPSVAVLPFANRSGDEEDEYFSDGLADELLSVLAKIRGLRVAARTSSATFKGKSATIAEVGRALNVAAVLEGSVRKAGKRVRIAVQLVKVADGYPLWSETYDRTLDDIFAVQDDIARSVVKELRTALLGESDSDASGEARDEVAEAARRRGENPEAHRLYLQGKHLVDRMNRKDLTRGIEYLRQALALDPGLAPAHAYLSRAYSWEAGYGLAPVREGYRRAREEAERALALDPDLAEAHVMLASIKRMHDWDWKGAEASARRALQLAPSSAEALREAGELAQSRRRPEEALELYRRAIEQDPLHSGSYNRLGYVSRILGRFAEAEEALRKSLELAPQRITSHLLLAILFADQGRDAEALAEAEQEAAEWARLTALGYLHNKAGRRAESEKALHALEARHAVEAGLQIATMHAILGDKDAAFAWLERAYEQRDAGLAQIRGEPTLDVLHDDPRWSALLRKMGFDAG